METVDYDHVAPLYDRRYQGGGPAGLAAFVRARCPQDDARAVLDDPILTRDGTCQLSLLSDAAF